ncbi:DJ-1/PfpI family protein [Carboxylicivirga sp. A043]|uniref:DJ-1 family glyoxalase III n=1 Tax=Carboxylicivirga litoralis TaxID=2816963 RepID=UPI0021CB4037|nr:DJ-1 family glyoxalase III [Carboxylicivirga sp. A043]MCU4156043.1 DJ-1/PfpI family protein [Carboxylicivirga sp. A043]
MKQIALFLADGFEEVEALTPVDVLRRAELQVTTISISETKNVCGAHNITVIADQLFSETNFSTFDALVLPGGMPGTNNLNAHEGLKKVVLQFAKDGKLLGAICAAPLVFGELGLLKNKEATCYPGFEDKLKGARISKQQSVKDDQFITANGIGAAMQFSLNLVSELCGIDKASELAGKMLVR